MHKDPPGTISGRRLYRVMQENAPELVKQFEKFRDEGMPLALALAGVELVAADEGRDPESADIMRKFIHYLYEIPLSN